MFFFLLYSSVCLWTIQVNELAFFSKAKKEPEEDLKMLSLSFGSIKQTMKDVMKSRKNLIGYKDNPIGLFPLKVDLQFVSLLASRDSQEL